MDKIRIHEMLECLVEVAHAELKFKGAQNVDTKEMGEVVDMIKDMAEAEKCVWEKCYYKSVVEAMQDEDAYDKSVLKEMIEKYGEKDGRAGYDRWRRSSGRFAPKGQGHETSMAVATGRAGYDPKMPPYYDGPYGPWNDVMGYDGRTWTVQESADRRSNGGSNHPNNTAGRMGYDGEMPRRDTAWDKYEEAKRHYHETSDPSHKQKMSEYAKQCVDETIGTMKDIFVEADPQMQQKMKDDLFRLYREFGGK